MATNCNTSGNRAADNIGRNDTACCRFGGIVSCKQSVSESDGRSYQPAATRTRISRSAAFRRQKARSSNCEKRTLASSYLSVGPQGTTRLPMDGFSRNLISDFFYICRESSSVTKNLKRITSILHGDRQKFSIISR